MKAVYITKHDQGYGWGHKKIVTVSHDCILGRYLDGGVMSPRNTLYELSSKLNLNHDDVYEFSSAISCIDDSNGTDSDLRQVRKLAKLLKMSVRVFHGK